MRASRLVTLLFVLQRRRAATAAELAAELDVSERTIYRDVAALTGAGVPLWTEPGPTGGIRLVDGWRTRLDGLTAPEAAALLGVAAPQVLSDLGMGAALAGAQAKLLATMPETLRTQAALVAQRVHVDAPGWFHAPRPVAALGAVAEAVWARAVITVRYERGPGPVERTLEPLGLVLKAGVWYLVAAVAGEPVGGAAPLGGAAPVAAGPPGVGAAIRTYRLDRVVAAVPTGATFTRPDGFDLAAHWAASARRFEGSLLRASVRLRLSPRGARMLPGVTDTEAAHRALADAVPSPGAERPSGGDATPGGDRPSAGDTAARGDGWTVVTLEHEGEAVISGQLLGLGPEVEVLEPASVRARLADLARRTAELNAP